MAASNNRLKNKMFEFGSTPKDLADARRRLYRKSKVWTIRQMLKERDIKNAHES